MRAEGLPGVPNPESLVVHSDFAAVQIFAALRRLTVGTRAIVGAKCVSGATVQARQLLTLF